MIRLAAVAVTCAAFATPALAQCEDFLWENEDLSQMVVWRAQTNEAFFLIPPDAQTGPGDQWLEPAELYLYFRPQDPGGLTFWRSGSVRLSLSAPTFEASGPRRLEPEIRILRARVHPSAFRSDGDDLPAAADPSQRWWADFDDRFPSRPDSASVVLGAWQHDGDLTVVLHARGADEALVSRAQFSAARLEPLRIRLESHLEACDP